MRRLALIAVAVAIAGCGPTQPQAPLDQAKKIDDATSGISTACGEASQVTAFAGDHRADLATLEAIARSKARRLASVYTRNPRWIYQGETVRKIVQDAVSTLRSCGLDAAAAALRRATGA